MINNARQTFLDIYKKEAEKLFSVPYRICPIGAHSDHQYGLVTGFAINKYLHIAYSKKNNGVVELYSLQFDKRAQWAVNSVPEIKQLDWADYLRGATMSLKARYPLFMGLSAVIDGEMPIGGLSQVQQLH